jgi:ribosomal protein S18 acetylase RimI-like enzyme
MIISTRFSQLAFAFLQVARCLETGPQTILGPTIYPDIKVKEASAADAATISNITIEAFKALPHFHYFRQYFDLYPHDAFDCLKAVLNEALTWPNVTGYLGVVPAIESPHEDVAVSAAVWLLPASAETVAPIMLDAITLVEMPQSDIICRNRDVNRTRAADFMRQNNKAEQRYLNDVYPEEQQLYLSSLATLPAYQGHDIAGHLLRKGLNLIDDVPSYSWPRELYATLMATKMGEPLYFENGYESIKNITIYALDTKEEFVFDVMVKQLRP